MKKLSRRNILKGSLAGVAAMQTTSVLAAVTKSEAVTSEFGQSDQFNKAVKRQLQVFNDLEEVGPTSTIHYENLTLDVQTDSGVNFAYIWDHNKSGLKLVDTQLAA